MDFGTHTVWAEDKSWGSSSVKIKKFKENDRKSNTVRLTKKYILESF